MRERGLLGVLPGDFPTDLWAYEPASIVDFGAAEAGRSYVSLRTVAPPQEVSRRFQAQEQSRGWQVTEAPRLCSASPRTAGWSRPSSSSAATRPGSGSNTRRDSRARCWPVSASLTSRVQVANPVPGRRGLWLEAVAIVAWAIFVVRSYLDFDPATLPSSGEWLASLQQYHFSTSARMRKLRFVVGLERGREPGSRRSGGQRPPSAGSDPDPRPGGHRGVEDHGALRVRAGRSRSVVAGDRARARAVGPRLERRARRRRRAPRAAGDLRPTPAAVGRRLLVRGGGSGRDRAPSRIAAERPRSRWRSVPPRWAAPCTRRSGSSPSRRSS